MLLSKDFKLGKNGKNVEGYLPKPGNTALWLIEWKINEEVHQNHYLAYDPVISLNKYLYWKRTILSN